MSDGVIIVGGKYALGKKLGSGSFGDIYYGLNKDLPSGDIDKIVAIKLENNTNDIKVLPFESKIYKYINPKNLNKGFPKIYWAGIEYNYNVLVMEILGPNLETLMQRMPQKKFSLKTVCQMAIEMIKILSDVHSYYIIHRDLKPENFVIGNDGSIKLIDFGLCKLYWTDGKHIEFKKNSKLVGTVRYCSTNTHTGHEQSRRDDLESLGYLLVYFMKGRLPWQGIGIGDPSKDRDLVRDMKMQTPTATLCDGLPIQFKQYLDYVKSLGFYDKPDYNKLCKLFLQLYNSMGYQHDKVYDWTELLISSK